MGVESGRAAGGPAASHARGQTRGLLRGQCRPRTVLVLLRGVVTSRSTTCTKSVKRVSRPTCAPPHVRPVTWATVHCALRRELQTTMLHPCSSVYTRVHHTPNTAHSLGHWVVAFLFCLIAQLLILRLTFYIPTHSSLFGESSLLRNETTVPYKGVRSTQRPCPPYTLIFLAPLRRHQKVPCLLFAK